jgi:hypothetical protein
VRERGPDSAAQERHAPGSPGLTDPEERYRVSERLLREALEEPPFDDPTLRMPPTEAAAPDVDGEEWDWPAERHPLSTR